MYDAIVVGARCAGAPTAMLLARKGAQVLLVDRARFPSDSVNGHAIKPPGVAYLQRWGLLDAVLATGCPPIYERAVWIDGRPLPVPPPVAGSLPIVAPRRTVLDLTLVEAAAAAGVDVHDRTTPVALLRDAERVSGIEAIGHHGRPLRAVAPVVIGADGKRSWVARQVGAAFEHYQPPVTIAYYTYWSGCQVDGLALHFGAGRAAGVFPTNDGQVLAFIQHRWTERDAFRADVSGNYLAGLRAFPALADALAGATYESPIRGVLDMPAYFRTSYGPGWALAGDAAHHKDPLIARGISDAFRDAELLSQALCEGSGSERATQRALARYQHVREASSWQLSALNHRLAELPADPAELTRRLGELSDAEAAADALLAATLHAEDSAAPGSAGGKLRACGDTKLGEHVLEVRLDGVPG